MVCAVAGNEPSEVVALHAELVPDSLARPQFDALSVLSGQHHLIAEALLLHFGGREV